MVFALFSSVRSETVAFISSSSVWYHALICEMLLSMPGSVLQYDQSCLKVFNDWMYEYSISPISRNSAPNVIFCPPALKARSASLRMSINCVRMPCVPSIQGHFSCMRLFMVIFSFIYRRTYDLYDKA